MKAQMAEAKVHKREDRFDPLGKVKPVLTKGERIQGFARQVYILAPLHRDLAVVTNRRLIFFQPKLLGRFSFTDFLWQEVDDVKVRGHVLSATLIVGGRKQQNGKCVAVTQELRLLEKMPAQGIYALAQEIEEEWREKNRVRKMEEQRAESGGTVIHTPWVPSGNAYASGSGMPSVHQRLSELLALRNEGLISDAEYEARKAQIIGDI